MNFLDSWRGLAIVSMVLYHLMFDLINIYGYDLSWWEASKAYIWQQITAWSFIIISGWTLNLNKNPKKSVLTLISLSVTITIVTKLFMPGQAIYFGVIHMLGIGVLIGWIFKGVLEKIPSILGGVVTFLLFLMTKNISNGYLSVFSNKYFISETIYERGYLFWLGFPSKSFSSGDYFPLIPWIFLYITGYFLGKLYKEGKLKIPKTNFKIISWLGNKSLLIYILHQPIILVLLNWIVK